MATFFPQLRQVSHVSGGNSGDQLELTLIPENMDGAAVYVRALMFRLYGTLTSTAGGAANLPALIANVLLQIPGISPALVNVSGSKLVRLFRIANGGERPPITAPASWTTALQAGSNAIDITIPVEFSDVNARRLDDYAIPAALLRQGTLKVSFAAITAAIADATASNLTLEVTAECVRKRERRCPPLPIIESTDIAGVEPVLSAKEGRIRHAFISPQADGLFLNGTDWATGGIGFGELKLCEDASDIGIFYGAFNRLSTTAIEKHTAAQTDRQSFIPLVFPPGGKQGQHVTFEVVPAGYKPRFKVNAAAANGGYAYTTRYVLDQRSPAMQKARQLLRFKAVKPMPASHKPSQAVEVNAYVPLKDPSPA